MARIIRIEDREYHMVHEYLAVVVPLYLDRETKTIDKDGITYSATVETWRHKITVKPFIKEVDVRWDSERNEHYLDDDDPIDNHWTAAEAREIAAELIDAADYLDKLEANHV